MILSKYPLEVPAPRGSAAGSSSSGPSQRPAPALHHGLGVGFNLFLLFFFL